MKIIFRINYYTIPGQSLWLKYSTVLGKDEVRIDQVVPMHWINETQWETSLEINATHPIRLEHAYQFRQSSNGIALDEWDGSRTRELDFNGQDTLLLLDTWCSAGTVDYAFETNAVLAVLPARGSFADPEIPEDANHSFRLRMAAVPEGHVPCIIGSVREIGDWGWHSAIPLVETAANVWAVNLYLPADWHVEYKYALFNLATKCVSSLEWGENRNLAPRSYSLRQWTSVSDECYRRDASGIFRGAGVAMPVFSLRSAKGLGVGEFADLKPFAEWAQSVGLKLIQILPVNDTTSSHDWTDSYPYSAISVFALHPLYLRIDDLGYEMDAGFLKEIGDVRDVLNALDQVDYVQVIRAKTRFTRQVFVKHHAAIIAGRGFRKFMEDNGESAVPYAVFCVKRDHYGTADFSRWEEWAKYDGQRAHALAVPEHPEWPEVSYHLWLQYELDLQLADAVTHLHGLGLALKGDLPIGIDRESVDAWASPHLFKMDAQAGAPPDAFAVKGQNWGFPTYNWEVMQRDGYAWWRSRFGQLSRYFDAYRIDHILGFFRIWQVPVEQTEGIMGHFDPAMPIHIEEIRGRGINFDFIRYCRPYIREHFLWERFGAAAEDVKRDYLLDHGSGCFSLREEVSTQRKITDSVEVGKIRDGLLDCASEVLFLEVPGSGQTLFHPRCSMQSTRSYRELHSNDLWRVEELYNDYFFRRHEDFWQARAYEKLPAMREASPMLLCGEDLGMVPACVPGVLTELGILSLEIQRMPKTHEIEFFHPANAPYLSVVSPSTHDMPTLRAWWEEDAHTTAGFAWEMFRIAFPEKELSGDIAKRIIRQHLESPAMWAIFPLQDLLAMDETLRYPDPAAERINVPAIMPFYWRYRMHMGIEELAGAGNFNEGLAGMIQETER